MTEGNDINTFFGMHTTQRIVGPAVEAGRYRDLILTIFHHVSSTPTTLTDWVRRILRMFVIVIVDGGLLGEIVSHCGVKGLCRWVPV